MRDENRKDRFSSGVWRMRVALFVGVMLTGALANAQQRPNIVFIMGDDIGWFNIGAYH